MVIKAEETHTCRKCGESFTIRQYEGIGGWWIGAESQKRLPNGDFCLHQAKMDKPKPHKRRKKR